jgi:hypothetical protein
MTRIGAPPARHIDAMTRRLATIIAQHARGMTLQAIGTTHGITKERVRQLLNTAGVVTGRPGYSWEYWTERQVAGLRAGLAAGLTAAAIGRGIGKTRNSVIGKARRLNLALNAKPGGRAR